MPQIDLGGRRLVTWDYRSAANDIGNLKLIPFPGLVNTPNPLAPVMGFNTSEKKKKCRISGYTTYIHPSNLMLRWMHGADYSYIKSGTKSTLKETQFSDMGTPVMSWWDA